MPGEQKMDKSRILHTRGSVAICDGLGPSSDVEPRPDHKTDARMVAVGAEPRYQM